MTLLILLVLIYFATGVGTAALVRLVGFPNAGHMLCPTPDRNSYRDKCHTPCIQRRCGAKPLTANEHFWTLVGWPAMLLVFVVMWCVFPIAWLQRYGNSVRF